MKKLKLDTSVLGGFSIPRLRATRETAGHRLLKRKLSRIMQHSELTVDREVHLNLTGRIDARGNLADERSIDLVARFSVNGKNCLVFFECKDREEIGNVRQVLSAWQSDLGKINPSNERIRVLNSRDETIGDLDFRRVGDVRLCFVFSEKISHEKFEEYRGLFEGYSIYAWDSRTLEYYCRISEVLENWTRYEIFREFNLSFESRDKHSERALEITQPGYPEFYILGMHPGLLLKIGYVYRRTSTKPDAYQRILNKHRLQQIAEFLKTAPVLLPNAIIIVFDEDQTVQEQVRYDRGRLEFPVLYCSAWIIDGQHRIFGFLKTKFGDWSQDSNEEFKLPVVAFKKLDSVSQNRTFVNINYYQKKIDPTLLCDLATATQDLKNELTWPSLLVAELNKCLPLKDKVKISEFDTGRPITLSGFARYGLLEGLLGFSGRTKEYRGTFFRNFPFRSNEDFGSSRNQRAFRGQTDLLIRFFQAIHAHTWRDNLEDDPWSNFHRYSLLKTTGINALLLVLSKIMAKYPTMSFDLEAFMKPVMDVNFERDSVAAQGGGWKGFRNLANDILQKLNTSNRETLQLFGRKDKM